MINRDDFDKVEIRAGTIKKVEEFPEAKKPAYKLIIDFGPIIGEKKSSAQLTANYRAENLLGKQIIGVVNLPPKQIGRFNSEVLVLGLPDENGQTVLSSPDKRVPNGAKMF